MATRSDPRRKSPARKVNRTATATRRARLVTAVAALSRKVYGTATATRHARVVTAVAALTVVGLGVGLGLTQTGDGGAKRGSTTFLLTASGLESFAKDHGSPIYWVGPQLGADYELTSSPDGRVFLSYIPAGSRPRAQGAYVSVGTYPLPNAFAATSRAARKKSFVRVKVGGGVAAAYVRGRPTNVYLAFPGVDYQVELFDPHPAEARKLVLAGRVVPVP